MYAQQLNTCTNGGAKKHNKETVGCFYPVRFINASIKVKQLPGKTQLARQAQNHKLWTIPTTMHKLWYKLPSNSCTMSILFFNTKNYRKNIYLLPKECKPPPDTGRSSKKESSSSPPPSRSSKGLLLLLLRLFLLTGGGVLGKGGALFSKFFWFLASTELRDGPPVYRKIRDTN